MSSRSCAVLFLPDAAADPVKQSQNKQPRNDGEKKLNAFLIFKGNRPDFGFLS